MAIEKIIYSGFLFNWQDVRNKTPKRVLDLKKECK